MRNRKKFLALIVAFALALTACGDDASSDAVSESEPAASTTTQAVEVIDVVADVDAMVAGLPDGWLSIKTVEDLEAAIEQTDPLLIDVREVGEYEGGHIPDAVNIPIRELTKHVDSIPLDEPVIVYCASGYRAAMATVALRSLGYENVRAFSPSYKGWTAAERDVSVEATALPVGVAKDFAPELLDAVSGFLVTMPEGYLNIGDTEKMEAAIEAGAFVVDVREVSEYEAGHIPGSVNIPLRTLIARSDELPTDRQVVVYCQSGYRAAMANASLGVAGWENVKAFSPSWAGWTAAGLDVET